MRMFDLQKCFIRRYQTSFSIGDHVDHTGYGVPLYSHTSSALDSEVHRSRVQDASAVSGTTQDTDAIQSKSQEFFHKYRACILSQQCTGVANAEELAGPELRPFERIHLRKYFSVTGFFTQSIALRIGSILRRP